METSVRSEPSPTSCTATLTSILIGQLLCPTPSSLPHYNNSFLPNPFLLNNGRQVRTKLDWTCRRAEIAALIQGTEAGTLPGKPQKLSYTFSKTGTTGNLTITATEGKNTISWSNPITYPNGTMPRNGWPLVVGYDGGSIPVPDGVRARSLVHWGLLTSGLQIATLHYANSNMALQNDQSSRGVGLFYSLYGNVTASSMTAWVWGLSRIIDGLEATPSAHINTKKIAVTGCSRDGKGALMAGAFEPRIALTIPQESGSGGDACWRLSKYEQDEGSVVQTATEIVQENVWFSVNFDNYVNDLGTQPIDHHLLAAMIAPRPMISFENTDFVWLSPLSSYGCMTAAHTVWDALGVPSNHGFEQVGGHQHCAWPASLTPALNSFFDKFLLDEDNVKTDYFATNGLFNNVTWNPAQWINWKTPKLI